MNTSANYNRRKLYKSLNARMSHALRHSDVYCQTGNPADCAAYNHLALQLIGLHQYIGSTVAKN